MSNAQRRMIESQVSLAEKKLAFDEADRAHHAALCSRDADLTAIQLAASRMLNAGCELSRVVGLHILTLDRLRKSEEAA